MKKNFVSTLILITLSFLFIYCQKVDFPKIHTLVITSDFGSVKRCKNLDELHMVAKTMISAKPDIMAMDVASPDLVNYKSEIGFLIPGSNFDALMEQGYDPFGIMVDTLRSHDIIVMANVRMNDHHGRLIQWTPWEREHKEWSLAKDTGARDWKAIGALRHMDYAIEGVRKYRFSILKEIVERFNIDGIQLDFGRTAPFVSEPKLEKGKFMTEYIREVRKLLDQIAQKRNVEKKYLGAIVPWDFDFCIKEGLEVKTWIDEGLIDYISPGEWYYADWNIPLNKWREITARTGCKLYPFTPGNVSPYQVFEYGEKSILGENRVLDGPKIRAIADNVLSQNPDGFAFYNFYTFDYGQYYPELRTWTNPDCTKLMSKHYFNCRKLMYHANELETFDIGVAFERYRMNNIGDTVNIPFRFASDISQSKAIIRFAFKNMVEQDEIAVSVNGIAISPEKIWTKTIQPDSSEAFNALFWESKITMPPLKPGENQIEFELKKQAKSNLKTIQVGEFEILIESVK